ncbi:CDP-diacylglycerol--serine O-phosphatidyltransferase [bacterium]|nr:CDP-diacylglycerol--serine O-phosphatidyltransferase [bacterium]
MKRNVLLPNIITAGNLLFGFFALMLILNEEYVLSAMCVFIAMLCDFLDGHVARFSHGTSPFGLEFDSLSDMVSFGVVPALLAYSYYLNEFKEIGVFIASFYAVACGIRLAKFNVTAHNSSGGKKIFSGLPSPAAAGVVCANILLINRTDNVMLIKFLPVTVLLAGLLMVSKVRYPIPITFFFFLKNRIRGLARAALASILLYLLFAYTESFLYFGFVGYAFFGIARTVLAKKEDRVSSKIVHRVTSKNKS